MIYSYAKIKRSRKVDSSSKRIDIYLELWFYTRSIFYRAYDAMATRPVCRL